MQRPLPGDFEMYDVIVWGMGNHQTDTADQHGWADPGHYGVNSAGPYTSSNSNSSENSSWSRTSTHIADSPDLGNVFELQANLEH